MRSFGRLFGVPAALGLLPLLSLGCSDGSYTGTRPASGGTGGMGTGGNSGSGSPPNCRGPNGSLHPLATYRVGCNTCVCETDGSIICTAVACGNACSLRDRTVCAPTEYCALDPSTCGAAGEGHCTLKPVECPDLYAPVCTCSNETVSNQCWAAANGATVVSQGECPHMD